jgi:hypothetical protein
MVDEGSDGFKKGKGVERGGKKGGRVGAVVMDEGEEREKESTDTQVHCCHTTVTFLLCSCYTVVTLLLWIQETQRCLQRRYY